MKKIVAESIKLCIVGEGTAKILTGHMPFIALGEGHSLIINGVPAPVTGQFLIATKRVEQRTSVTIFAPEIPDLQLSQKPIP